MSITQLLFSFDGKIGRFQYFIASFVVGIIALLTAVGGLYLAFDGNPDLKQMEASALISLSLGILFWFIVWMAMFGWMQFALVFKRCRDAFGITTLAKIYVASTFLMWVPILNLLIALFDLVFILLLLFKKGEDVHGFNAAEIFGEVEAELVGARKLAPQTAGNALDDPEYDLVARAAQLKSSSPQSSRPRQQSAQPVHRPPAGGFGQRPAFGKR